MYITTSRKPSDSTRALASNMASFLNSTYENRGKKSIEDIVSRARLLGFRRVMVISETKGNPNRLTFLSIGKGWDWMEPEIIFSIPTHQLKERVRPLKKEVELLSDDKRLADLFDIPEPMTDDVVRMGLRRSSISFSYKDKRLALTVKELLERVPDERETDEGAETDA